MAFMNYNINENRMFIFEERTQTSYEAPIGDLLFSFLELDLKQYNMLYDFIGNTSCSIEKKKEYLSSEYPQTTNEFEILFQADTAESFLPFLLMNQDTFYDIYQHPYLSCSVTFNEGHVCNFDDMYHDCNLAELQKRFKELLDFCFLPSERIDINELSSIERYYLFTTSKLFRYKYVPNFQTTLFFSPTAFYTSLLEKNLLHNPNAENFNMNEISSELVQQIKGKVKIAKVNECNTVEDFLFFEFYTLLSQNLSIKRCANCGKLFIPSGKYNTDCCDRIPNGEKYSCKKIMAQKRRKRATRKKSNYSRI